MLLNEIDILLTSASSLSLNSTLEQTMTTAIVSIASEQYINNDDNQVYQNDGANSTNFINKINGVNLDECSVKLNINEANLNCLKNSNNQEIVGEYAEENQEEEQYSLQDGEDYFNDYEEEEQEEDIDDYLNLNRTLRNESCCIITNNANSDSAYSSPTISSTASSSPNSTSSSLFKLSTDSLASFKYPLGRLRIGYSGRAKLAASQSSNDDDDLSFNIKAKLGNYLSENDRLLDSDLLDVKLNYGDDCGFILSSNRLKKNYYFGIADGVSANRLRGYDARLFPLALLNECTNYILLSKNQKEEDFSISKTVSSFQMDDNELLESNDCYYLYETLLNSHARVQEKCVYGSSTVCLFSLKFQSNSNALLSTCNLGDSGYMIIRNQNVLFKSPSQSHRYNAPFQLGCTPPELLEHDLYRDKADDSIMQTHEIQSGDILVISTDGLFDNLYEDEIALIINEHIQNKLTEHNSEKQFSSNLETHLNKLNLDDSYEKTVMINEQFESKNVDRFEINNDILESACDMLVQKASKAGIKRDDMLIKLVYIE